MALHRSDLDEIERLLVSPVFSRPGETSPTAKDELPHLGRDPHVVYRLIHDELMLDGNARQNLATFVTTFMDEHADRLFAETLDKNMIDKDEYPQTAAIEGRCVTILSNLWHSPGHETATGTSTTGSSEAVMLGGLALKWRWRQRQEAAGKPVDRPNLVMSCTVQVVWEKFCRYWDVEPRYAPVEEGRLDLDAEQTLKLVDENTIGVVAILGSTYDGSYEPVQEIAAALDELAASGGPDIPVHVDAASGGFVAPFIDPDLEWDFRVPRVRSINASGHKYGLVYPGVGWILWRTPEDLPEDLVFHVNYLGGDMPTFALNFSRPGSQVVGQYYNFLRLGFEGYREIQQACRDNARYLADEVAATGPYELLSDGSALPVFFFRLRADVTNYTVFDVSAKLRERGWQVPAYTLPAPLDDVAGLRVVVRNGFGRDLADMLLDDLRRATEYFEDLAHPLPPDPSHTSSFAH
ncbi:glutamate decarboxylase [Luteimicrobium subarcticum]|uniref:Glutamate decarboxylase n=1 Tax=Luteimicrobium subarcticum TaxID=620910 RepID=A0A2M8WUV3_9MICO|nr:glutamate decarboxylase [Luteimicrobium subarcticum]PJI94646.1 glutamate decarboxylase [Luteimicrobium subarcticum]